jgi:hypothetical protein
VQIVAAEIFRLGGQSVVTCSFRDLDDGIGGNGAAARATLFVEKVHDFSQGVGISRIPEKSALASHVDEADLFQFFQVMRKCGRRDAEFFLDFAGNHAFWMSGKEQPENLEARLSPESGEAVGGPGDQEGVGFAHSSIIAEIWKDVKLFLLGTIRIQFASYSVRLPSSGNDSVFGFDRVWAAWDTFCFRG